MNMYTVRDSKAAAYLPPFFAVNSATAIRMMQDTANDPSTLFHKHPEDFQIFFIATFNERTGEIIPNTHESLGKVIDLLGPFNEI